MVRFSPKLAELANVVMSTITALQKANVKASAAVIKEYVANKCPNQRKAVDLVPAILTKARNLGLIDKHGESYRTSRFIINEARRRRKKGGGGRRRRRRSRRRH